MLEVKTIYSMAGQPQVAIVEFHLPYRDWCRLEHSECWKSVVDSLKEFENETEIDYMKQLIRRKENMRLIIEGNPKEIADLLMKMTKGQREVIVNGKALAEAISDDSCENRLKTIHRQILQD